jgi:hypothetical protein
MNLNTVKRSAISVAVVGLVGLLGLSRAALAVATKGTGLDDTAQTIYGAAVPNAGLNEVVGTLVGGFLSLLGVVFVVLFVYSGVVWMTAGGAQDRIKKAQQTMAGAVIGFILVMGAWAISDFVISAALSIAEPGKPTKKTAP